MAQKSWEADAWEPSLFSSSSGYCSVIATDLFSLSTMTRWSLFPAALILSVSVTILFHGICVAQEPASSFSGTWRGEFIIRGNVHVPFNFQINKDGTVYLLNAEEKFQTGKINVQKDSLFIALDQFDNELAFRIKNNRLEGVLRKQDHQGAPLNVIAEKGKSYRFKPARSSAPAQIGGKYEVDFTFESGKKEKAVAILNQDGRKLTGTFLKQSGDARYLEGIVDGNIFHLSSFIGSSPGYYTGKVDKGGKITGEQLGSRITHTFVGKRNDSARLPDPFNESAESDRQPLKFSFPNLDGKMTSLSDEKYNNKVVIIPITGTWCPNCIDEAEFLSPWYKENRDRGIEIITIHYERQTDTTFAYKLMRRFRRRFDIQYDQLLGGAATGDSVRASLPALTSFKAFPTTVFIDKKGRIAKIHSGYTGPAAGKFYDEFLKEFNDEVDKLLRE
jgi:thiol-disulfide isomerase/thioredoxin